MKQIDHSFCPGSKQGGSRRECRLRSIGNQRTECYFAETNSAGIEKLTSGVYRITDSNLSLRLADGTEMGRNVR